jgi:hypothetical protein
MTTASSKRQMYAVTIAAAVPSDAGAQRTRTSVLGWLRRQREEDPIARAAHEALKSKDRHVDVIAALSKARRNTFVERVAILQPLEQVAASVQLPSFAANAERALPATRLLNSHSANRAQMHAGSRFEGMFVALFETGYSSLDTASRLLLQQLKEEGFKTGPTARCIADEIEAKATALVSGRHSWRRDLKIAFAPPELAQNLAAEQIHVERWLAELAAEHGGDETAYWQSVIEGLDRMRLAAAGSALWLCKAILDEATRRVKAVSATVGVRGVGYRIEFRAPDNDNDSSGSEGTRRSA